jgi:hypothetical protein
MGSPSAPRNLPQGAGPPAETLLAAATTTSVAASDDSASEDKENFKPSSSSSTDRSRDDPSLALEPDKGNSDEELAAVDVESAKHPALEEPNNDKGIVDMDAVDVDFPEMPNARPALEPYDPFFDEEIDMDAVDNNLLEAPSSFSVPLDPSDPILTLPHVRRYGKDGPPGGFRPRTDFLPNSKAPTAVPLLTEQDYANEDMAYQRGQIGKKKVKYDTKDDPNIPDFVKGGATIAGGWANTFSNMDHHNEQRCAGCLLWFSAALSACPSCETPASNASTKKPLAERPLCQGHHFLDPPCLVRNPRLRLVDSTLPLLEPSRRSPQMVFPLCDRFLLLEPPRRSSRVLLHLVVSSLLDSTLPLLEPPRCSPRVHLRLVDLSQHLLEPPRHRP